MFGVFIFKTFKKTHKKNSSLGKQMEDFKILSLHTNKNGWLEFFWHLVMPVMSVEAKMTF